MSEFTIDNYIINVRLNKDHLDITIFDNILFDHYSNNNSHDFHSQPSYLYNLIVDYFSGNKDISLSITKNTNDTIAINILLETKYYNINNNIILYKNTNSQGSNNDKILIRRIKELESLLEKHINSRIIIFDTVILTETEELFIGHTYDKMLYPTYLMPPQINTDFSNASTLNTRLVSSYRGIKYNNIANINLFIEEIKKLQKITNLKKLTINCFNTICTTEYLKFLPSNLESLEIWNFDDRTLNNIMHLKDLKFLKILWYSYHWEERTYSSDYKLVNVSTCIKKLLKTSPTLRVELSNRCKTSIHSEDKEATLIDNIKFI